MVGRDDSDVGCEILPIKSRRVVRGQTVDRTKLTRSKELWREMTAAEQLLWSCLGAKQLDGWHFRRQQMIYGFIADFYSNTAGVVVEVDGAVRSATMEYDAARDQHFRSRGLPQVRFANEDIYTNMRAVLQRIAAACAEGRRRV